MNNDTPKKVTLEQLYQQRKANHTLPAALREQLQQQVKAPKTKNLIRWQFAVPIAFASIMTVVLIVPNREQFNDEDIVFGAAPQSLSAVNAPSASNRSSEISTEFDSEITVITQQMESDLSYESAPAEAKTKALKPAINEQPIEEIMMSDSVSEITMADVIELPQSPVILLVTQGSQGLFENCEQEPVQLEAKTELEGWVKATWVEGEWRFEVIGESFEFGDVSCK